MGVVRGGPQLVEKAQQINGVFLHLEEELEKGINIVIIWLFVDVVNRIEIWISFFVFKKMGERRELNPRVVDSQSTALIHLATSAPAQIFNVFEYF